MTPPFRLMSPSALAVLLALAGCGSSSDEAERPLEPDPAVAAALIEPIMIDPDLAAQNRGNAAISLGSFDGVPAWTRNPDEIAAARAAAVKLAGGSMQAAPGGEGEHDAGGAASRPRELAADLPGMTGRCLQTLRDGFAWAADMPKAAPIYPGGHVLQAAGARRPCSLRALRYVTSAETRDVLDFHFTLLTQAGFEAERRGDALVARRGGAAARIVVARLAGGMTEVALASSI